VEAAAHPEELSLVLLYYKVNLAAPAAEDILWAEQDFNHHLIQVILWFLLNMEILEVIILRPARTEPAGAGPEVQVLWHRLRFLIQRVV
jgi:hypothetical protein